MGNDIQPGGSAALDPQLQFGHCEERFLRRSNLDFFGREIRDCFVAKSAPRNDIVPGAVPVLTSGTACPERLVDIAFAAMPN
jgi:hypothetical protein